MTLAEAGEAIEPEDKQMTAQAWGLYEQGKRPLIHRPEVADRMLKAIHADRDEFDREIARQAGVPTDDAPPARAPEPTAHAVRSFSVSVLARAKPDTERGVLVYDARQSDATVDLGWLFGPTAGHLRMADDRLKGRVNAGQLIHYDRAMPPRTDQVCVVDTAHGLHVYVYRELAGGKLMVQQTNPDNQVEFDLADVRGVYAVRLIGD